MRREKVAALADAVWFTPIAGDVLEIAIVPARLADICQPFTDSWSGMLEERVVREGFVDFRGYTDELGKPIENSVTARRELLGVGLIRTAIKTKVWEINGSVAQGEPVAASV